MNDPIYVFFSVGGNVRLFTQNKKHAEEFAFDNDQQPVVYTAIKGPKTPPEWTLAGCRCVLFGKGNPHWPCPLHTLAAQPQPVAAEAIKLNIIRRWPEGFEDRLQHVWLDVVSFIPNVKLYDLQRVLAEFGFRMEIYEDAALSGAGNDELRGPHD